MGINVGDVVVFNSKYELPKEYQHRIMQVDSAPCAVAGRVVVWLKDYPKPYPTDGLVKIFCGLEEKE